MRKWQFVRVALLIGYWNVSNRRHNLFWRFLKRHAFDFRGYSHREEQDDWHLNVWESHVPSLYFITVILGVSGLFLSFELSRHWYPHKSFDRLGGVRSGGACMVWGCACQGVCVYHVTYPIMHLMLPVFCFHINWESIPVQLLIYCWPIAC